MATTPPISPFQAGAYYTHSKDNGLLMACPNVAKPCADDSAQLTVIDESNGEKFALFKGKKDAQSFGHFDPKNQAWHERPFHLITSMDVKNGTVSYLYRNPTALSHDDGFLFVKLDNGQEVRAHIRPGPLFFAENSPESHSDSIFSSLHGIASMDAYPNMVLNIRIPYMDMAPAELSDRFEKKQAADYLEQQIKTCQDPREIKTMQAAIAILRANERDDTIVFKINHGVSGNQYCSAAECTPIISLAHYNDFLHYFSQRFSNMFPDALPIHPKDWAYITEPLQQPILSAEEERERLSETCVRYELVLGGMTGLTHDIGGWLGNGIGVVIPGFLPGVGPLLGQTNCNYEFLNLYDLLTKLRLAGLLKYHHVGDSLEEGLSSAWGMHQALSLYENNSDKVFVLDSWPKGNGHPPMIVPASDWGLLSASSLQILPTVQSMRLSPPESRLASGAVGLFLSAWYASANIGKRLTLLAQLTTQSGLNALQKDPIAAYLLREYDGYMWLKVTNHTFQIPVRDGVAMVRIPQIYKSAQPFIPKHLIIDQDKHYCLLNPNALPMRVTLKEVAKDFFKTPKGIINVGVAACFAIEFLGAFVTRKSSVISDTIKDNDENAVAQTVVAVAELGGMAGAWHYIHRHGLPSALFKEAAGKAAIGLAVVSAAASAVDVVESWTRSDIDLQVRDEEYQAALANDYHNSFFGDGNAPWYQRTLNTLGVAINQLPLPYATVYKLAGDVTGSKWREARKSQLEELRYKAGPYQNAVMMLHRTAATVRAEFSRNIAQQDLRTALKASTTSLAVQTQFRGWQVYAAMALREQDQNWLFKNKVVNDGIVSNDAAVAYWLENQLSSDLDAAKGAAAAQGDFELYQKLFNAKSELHAIAQMFSKTAHFKATQLPSQQVPSAY